MGGGKMKYFTLFCLLTLVALCVMPLRAAAEESNPSGSPYDSAIEMGKNTTSFVDALIDSGSQIDEKTAGKLADFLKNNALWKNLSGKAQDFLNKNISKLGPLVKKLGWIANAIDLAPSLYNTGLAFLQNDKPKFIEAFRDSTLKIVSIAGGLAIGAVVTAALPLVIPAVAAGGIGTVILAGGGAIVSVGMSMLADKVIKDNFSKNIESFASSVYDSLIYDSTFSGILGGKKGSGGKSSSGGVKLDALQW